jgi:hypothetical protein
MTLSIEYIWNELQTLGFKGSIQSIEELYKWIRTVHLVHTPPLLKQTVDGSLVYNSIHLKDVTIAMTGAFGVLYLVYRDSENESQYAFLKTSPTHPSSLLLEGILQSIAHSVLVQYNFPKAIPRVLDIIRHPTFGVALVLEKQPGARLFSDYLKTHVQWGSPCKTNDTLFLSVLAQIATYLAILEATIGMNHRDLTGTNVLMVDPDTPVDQSVQLNELSWKIHSDHQAILIDFGFACIGEHTGKYIASAGEYLPTTDYCPKQGRDLFLFFASLWSVELFRSSVTSSVHTLFSKWLHDKTSTNWSSWLSTSFENNMISMYLLTNAEHFQSPSCKPIQVLKDIESIHSNIVSFY